MASSSRPIFTLLNRGKTPSGGKGNERYVPHGRQGAPDVRISLVLLIRPKWLPDDSEVEIYGVEEGDYGQCNNRETSVKDGEAIGANVILYTLTQACRASLWHENPGVMHAEK